VSWTGVSPQPKRNREVITDTATLNFMGTFKVDGLRNSDSIQEEGPSRRPSKKIRSRPGLGILNQNPVHRGR
jgi:hypothetical protein